MGYGLAANAFMQGLAQGRRLAMDIDDRQQREADREEERRIREEERRIREEDRHNRSEFARASAQAFENARYETAPYAGGDVNDPEFGLRAAYPQGAPGAGGGFGLKQVTAERPSPDMGDYYQGAIQAAGAYGQAEKVPGLVQGYGQHQERQANRERQASEHELKMDSARRELQNQYLGDMAGLLDKGGAVLGNQFLARYPQVLERLGYDAAQNIGIIEQSPGQFVLVTDDGKRINSRPFTAGMLREMAGATKEYKPLSKDASLYDPATGEIKHGPGLKGAGTGLQNSEWVHKEYMKGVAKIREDVTLGVLSPEKGQAMEKALAEVYGVSVDRPSAGMQAHAAGGGEKKSAREYLERAVKNGADRGEVLQRLRKHIADGLLKDDLPKEGAATNGGDGYFDMLLKQIANEALSWHPDYRDTR